MRVPVQIFFLRQAVFGDMRFSQNFNSFAALGADNICMRRRRFEFIQMLMVLILPLLLIIFSASNC